MKKNMKAIIIVFVLLVIYSILVVIYADSKANKNEDEQTPISNTTIIDKKDDDEESDDVSIVITPNTVIAHNVDGWYEKKGIDYVNLRFNVYANNETYKNKQLTYSDKWYIMESNRNFIDYDEEIGLVGIVSSSNASYVALKEEKETVEDKAIIDSYLKERKIKYNDNTIHKHIFSYDVNKDGVKDKVFILTNVFIDDFSGYDKTFGFGFIRTLNQDITFYEDTNDSVNAMNMCYPFIRGILDYQNKNMLVFDCSYISNNGTKHILYNMEEKTIKKVIETKAN